MESIKMRKSINAVESKCNECDNKTCSATFDPCRGFKPFRKPGFSFLEIAIGSSATEVNNILNMAKLQFIPADTERGFHLAKI